MIKVPVTVIILLVIGVTRADESPQPNRTVRLAVVHTPESSGLLGKLVPDFEKQTLYKVVIESREDVYEVARRGKADLVISHYGHSGTQDFVTQGLGSWPRAVFANQAALIGPSEDPAGISGMNDAEAAFRRIAKTRSLFVVNNAATEKYLGEVLWHAAGKPDPRDWYVDKGLRNKDTTRDAIEYAVKHKGYTLWGLVPFLKYQEQHPDCDMKALVVSDPIFQRMMVCVVVNAEKISGVNTEGAKALERYLTAPATQAHIRTFRFPRFDYQIWWPAARTNSGAFLSAP